jgi:site-specific DNA recombinase
LNKVAIYCRLSDEDRNKINDTDDSESIQNQKNLLMRYAIDKGWDIYKIYSDDDYSGLDKDRPEFLQMINEAEAGKFDIILCKHQSRFTRDMELVEKYLHNKFIEWGIRFVTVVDGVDTKDKHNKKSRQINGLINEWYCEDISESIKAVFRSKQQQGKFIGAFATYGYVKDPNDRNKIIIDEEAAAVVRKIFNLYLQGHGTQHIAFILNDEGIPNPTKFKGLKGLKYINSSAKDNYGLWNKTTIKRIIKNPVYIGNLVQHQTEKVSYKSKKKINIRREDWVIVEGTHEAIIEKKDFVLAQERIKGNIRSSGIGQAHIFAGKIRCLDCGNTIVKSNNGTGREYLRCKLYAIDPKKQLCTIHSIRFDRLVELVEGKIRQHFQAINQDNIVSMFAKEINFEDKEKRIRNELKSIIREIDARNGALRNLYLDKTKGIIDEMQFEEFNAAFASEKKDFLNRKQFLEEELSKVKDKSKELENYKKIVQRYINFDKLSHVMVNELIDYIEIGEKDKETNDQKIKIHWLF